MKQTAVEWLIGELEDNGINLDLASELIEQAKEMEKQQIIASGNSCALSQCILNRKVDLLSLQELEEFAEKKAINFGELYYNETFKNK